MNSKDLQVDKAYLGSARNPFRHGHSARMPRPDLPCYRCFQARIWDTPAVDDQGGDAAGRPVRPTPARPMLETAAEVKSGAVLQAPEENGRE